MTFFSACHEYHSPIKHKDVSVSAEDFLCGRFSSSDLGWSTWGFTWHIWGKNSDGQFLMTLISIESLVAHLFYWSSKLAAFVESFMHCSPCCNLQKAQGSHLHSVSQGGSLAGSDGMSFLYDSELRFWPGHCSPSLTFGVFLPDVLGQPYPIPAD